MTHKMQGRNWLSGIRVRTTSAALALAVVVVGMVATPSAQAQSYKVLHSFTSLTDGESPYAALVAGGGNLYGTMRIGGIPAWGTVFKVDGTGKETVLYAFTGAPDGEYPVAGLVRDAAGNLYGTAEGGGAFGRGVVFKVDVGGTETVLYSFTGLPDAESPIGGLVRDAAGNLYGTTYGGGAFNRGTVFKLDTTGKETVLHSFAGPPTDGAFPQAALVRDAAGNLYGTTQFGGGSGACINYGCGTVFKVDTNGQVTVLYSFSGGHIDGSEPYAGLVRDAAGNLYGTTFKGGGGASVVGTVFKVDTSGKETVLYSFTGGADGANPVAGVIRDSAGNLYGATSSGGDLSGCGGTGCGVLFKVDTTGTETVLYTFTGGTDGARPEGSLFRDAAGNLYGTAIGGGSSGDGVVFKLTP